ncbi:MAG: hypothetical protein JW973_12185 [Bacteroidales bacterium]|nr:hypothetical protein [Bacteroidales bacterium]
MNSTMIPKNNSCLKRFCYRYVVTATVGLVVAFSSVAQPKNDIPGLREMIHQYSCAGMLQERLFVFLNSGYYYPGENLSFHAVLFDGNLKLCKNGSRFIYIQLISYTGNGIGNYIYELHSGERSGQIRLPDTLQTGLYTLKAYTRWMQNYDPDNAFRRPLLVISPLNTAIVTAVADSFSVRFYPEGGKLVAGTENKVLVRTNPYSTDLIRQLNIVDDRGQRQFSCTIDTNGVGVFSLSPGPGKKYYAMDAGSKETDQLYKLPDPEDNRYSLSITGGENGIHVSVACTPGTAGNADIYLAVLNHDAGRSFVRQVNMVNNRGALSIPSADLPAGLNQVLLFGNETILCSRLWYRKNNRHAWPATTITNTLKTRQSAICEDYLSGAVQQNNILAVSVNEYNPVTDSMLFNELSYCRYYDLYSSLSRPEVLPLFDTSATENYINDCLMACERTLPMDFILHARNENLYPRETIGIILTGRIESPVYQLPVDKMPVLLSYPDSIAHVDYSITSEKGDFSFTLNEKLYNKQLYLTAQGFPKSRDVVTIITDDLFRKTPSGTETTSFFHPCIEQMIKGHQNISMAYRVFYRNTQQSAEVVNYRITSYDRSFYGIPDFQLTPAEYEFLPDIFEIRKNLIPQLKLKLEDDYCSMTLFDNYLQIFHPQQAFVLLNNIPYPSLKNVLELNSDIIRSIAIKNDKHFYDNYLMHGIVDITTVKPVDTEPYFSTLITTVNVTPVTGKERAVPVEQEGSLPDLRHSLFWSAGRELDSAGTEIRFRTSDVKGKYQLKVFYIDPDGIFRCTEKAITVL